MMNAARCGSASRCYQALYAIDLVELNYFELDKNGGRGFKRPWSCEGRGSGLDLGHVQAGTALMGSIVLQIGDFKTLHSKK